MKFNSEPRHLYECTYPPPPETIHSYQHPRFPITCLSNGILILDDKWNISAPASADFLVITYKERGRKDDQEMLETFPGCSVYSSYCSPQTRLRGRSYIAYECYHQISLSSSQKIEHLDCNPYNLTIENLFMWDKKLGNSSEYQMWIKRYKKFITRTAEETQLLIQKAQQKGWDPDRYIELLALPKKYKKALKKISNIENRMANYPGDLYQDLS